MDVHTMAGRVNAADVARVHRKDPEAQDAYGVSYPRYWVDEDAGKVFHLLEADTADDAVTVRREAHGLVADGIYRLSEHR